MAKRKSLSKRTRFEVFKRDAFTCQYCGRTPPAVILHADHVIAVANGGCDDIANLVTSCADCNLGKSDRPLSSASPPLAESMERSREVAEQTEAYNTFLMDHRKRQLFQIERLGTYWYNQFYQKQNEFCFSPPRQRSMMRFLKSIIEAQLYESIDTAFLLKPPRGDDDDETWRYFCGICWRIIKGATTDEA